MKTTREAALKSCKDRLEHLENAPSHHCGKRQRQRAIELEKVKIEALRPVSREQVEKVFPRCDFCKIELDDYPYIVARGDYDSSDTCYEPSFCPICGKPLTDKAVDMVMERLEALGYSKDD